MKRLLSLLLVLITVVTVFAGCQGPAATQGPGKTQQQQTGKKDVDEWGRPWVDSVIPDELDFGGQKVNILLAIGSHSYRDYYAEAYNDDIINDSVFDRNVKVETDLGVDLNWVLGSETSATTLPSEIATIVDAGTNDYDIAAGYGNYMPVGVTEGTYTNLYDVPYLKDSLEQGKPWWNKTYIDEASLNGYMYTITGDISLSSTYLIGCMFFNKRLANERYASIGGAEAIYKLVLDGKWTIDKFTELVKTMYEDLDTDGLPSMGDFYGYGTWMSGPMPANAFQYAMNAPISRKNAEGIPELVFDSQQTINMINKLHILTTDCEGVLFDTKYYNDHIARNEMIQKFINGTMIFVTETLQEANNFRNMKDDYGLLPMPMLDEAQFENGGYMTTNSDAFSTLVIPYGILDADRGELAGATLEKLCEESYRTVNPNYFEVVMKYRYLRSDDDEDYDLKMYDIILESMTYNFGMIYNELLDHPGFILRWLIGRDASTDFASAWNGQKKRVQARFKGLVNFFLEDAE